MQGQQALSVSKLKRQLSFLKSIDQKLEGLRRENERLRRIVSNPRVRFSRSSLGGLYRIVNSMTSAGPMHGLDTIEQWAQKTRDWLVELGKRGSGPSNDELDWLVETISELSDLRDTALAATKEALKTAKVDLSVEEEEADLAEDERNGEDGLDDERDSEEPPLTEEETTEAPSQGDAVSAESEGFPFTEEPKAKSIPQAEFWKGDDDRAPGRGFRDQTSTIPLAIDDLTSVNPPTPPLGPPPMPVVGAGPGFWKPLAIVSLVGFLAMTALFFWSRGELSRIETDALKSASNAAKDAVSSPPANMSAPKEKVDIKPADPTATPEEPKSTDPSSPEAQPSQIEDKSAALEKAAVAPSDRPSKPASPKADTPEKKKKKKKTETTATAPAKENKVVGTLQIKAPADGGSVLVLVDGVSRGKAPVRVKLSPGLHEVVFSKDGKKTMRMVPIRPNATKTINATAP